MRKLTDEERQIVTDNHNLIYWFMNKRNLDREYWYGIIALALMKTVIHHDKSKSTLSTLFTLNANHSVSHELKYQNRIKRKLHNGLALDKDAISQIIPSKDTVGNEELINFNMDLEHVDPSLAYVVKRKLYGMTYMEIANELGITRQGVHKRMVNFRKEYFND